MTAMHDSRSSRFRPALGEMPSSVAYGSLATSIFRITFYVLWNMFMVPLQAMTMLISKKAATRVPIVYHRNCLRAMGVKVTRHGRPERKPATLYIANHSSYLDITILGAMLPVSFVAKSDIKKWPIFGVLAQLQRSVFIDRRPANAKSHAEEISERLNAGDSLVLFPEGTSGEGNHVLRFKSALFAVAQIEVHGRPVTVQPITIAYSRLDGMPMGRHFRPFYTWFGDMDIASHMGQLFGLGRVGIDVVFHPPVSFADFASRKDMAQHCERVIARGLSDALSGRLPASRRRAKARARRAGAHAALNASATPSAETEETGT